VDARNNTIEIISEGLLKHNCLVIIPTYNNQKTLRRVVDGVRQYTNHILIVNDGSTDDTKKILEEYSDLDIIHFKSNKGKGMALRKGFKRAIERGFKYAITIDSDGQHYPEDMIVFIDELNASETGCLLLIGSRNMEQSTVPKKSSFGNKFSNFWYRVETGIKLNDTQSGYRLYPLDVVSRLRFFTTKFELEIESIVKIAWQGVTVKNVPIKVLYDPDERVSHFRPFQDFTRISFLNLYLIFITFLWIKPRDFFISMKQKGFKKFFKENVLKTSESPSKKSSAIALGVLIGLSPLWGLHTFLAIVSAKALKLNEFLSFTFSNVSIPPMIPFIVIASIKIGGWITGKDIHISFSSLGEISEWALSIKEYLIGSIVLAIFGSALSWILSFSIISAFKKK